MSARFVIIAALALGSLQLAMPCVKVWEKDYAVFVYREQDGGTKVTNSVLDKDGTPGTITFSCSEVDVPAVCGMSGKARFIYAVEGAPCVVIRQPSAVAFPDHIEPADGKDEWVVRMTVEGQPEPGPSQEAPQPVAVHFEFRTDQFAKSSFRRTTGGFEVTVFTPSSPVHELRFLRVLAANPVLSTAIFLSLGLVLCFLGLKFYRDMLMFFIPMMIVVLGFYLYLAIVEKSVEQNDKLLLVLVTLLCLAAVIALAVTFTNAIYVVLC